MVLPVFVRGSWWSCYYIMPFQDIFIIGLGSDEGRRCCLDCLVLLVQSFLCLPRNHSWWGISGKWFSSVGFYLMSKIYAKYVSGVYSDLWGKPTPSTTACAYPCSEQNRWFWECAPQIRARCCEISPVAFHPRVRFPDCDNSLFFFLKKVGLKGEVFDGFSSTSFFLPAEFYGEEE